MKIITDSGAVIELPPGGSLTFTYPTEPPSYEIGGPPEAASAPPAAKADINLGQAFHAFQSGWGEAFRHGAGHFAQAWREFESSMTADKENWVPTAPLRFIYTNHRGETDQRTVIPMSVRFGSTKWHPKPQWLLKAFDLDKDAEREFAMGDIGGPAPDAGVDGMREAIQDILDRTYSNDRGCALDADKVAEIYDIAKAAMSIIVVPATSMLDLSRAEIDGKKDAPILGRPGGSSRQPGHHLHQDAGVAEGGGGGGDRLRRGDEDHHR